MSERTTFYSTDAAVKEIMAGLSGMLQQWGFRGSNNDVIRYALYYAAEGHGLRKSSPGRAFKRKGDGDGTGHDGQDRPVAADDGPA